MIGVGALRREMIFGDGSSAVASTVRMTDFVRITLGKVVVMKLLVLSLFYELVGVDVLVRCA